MSCNRVELSGRLAALDAVRYTPAGIPIINFSILHQSSQIESGMERLVQCEVAAMAVGPLAEMIGKRKAEQECRVIGFLAARNRKSSQLVLHVNEIRF